MAEHCHVISSSQWDNRKRGLYNFWEVSLKGSSMFFLSFLMLEYRCNDWFQQPPWTILMRTKSRHGRVDQKAPESCLPNCGTALLAMNFEPPDFSCVFKPLLILVLFQAVKFNFSIDFVFLYYILFTAKLRKRYRNFPYSSLILNYSGTSAVLIPNGT